MAELPGSSGASVSFSQWNQQPVAIKIGDERVGEQGAWLSRHECLVFPKVYSGWNNGYAMEVLTAVSGIKPYHIHEMLKEQVWKSSISDVFVEFDGVELQRRLLRALSFCPYEEREAHGLTRLADEVVDLLIAYYAMYSSGSLEYDFVHIHGDPTFENVMYRRPMASSGHSESLVLIDPLPARPYAPSLREIDLGKITQSVAGYEADRYDRGKEKKLGEMVAWLNFAHGAEDIPIEIILSWAIVHVFRTFPYINTATRHRLIHGSLQTIRELRNETQYAHNL